MNRIARIGATGAALTLASLPLIPGAAMAKGGPSIAQNEQQERVTASSNQSKAQVEYLERSQAALRLHYGVDPDSHPSKAQIEFNERSAGSPTSGQVSQPQPQLRISDNDAAVWQLAVSAAVGALLTGGVVLGTRGMGRRRQALAS